MLIPNHVNDVPVVIIANYLCRMLRSLLSAHGGKCVKNNVTFVLNYSQFIAKCVINLANAGLESPRKKSGFISSRQLDINAYYVLLKKFMKVDSLSNLIQFHSMSILLLFYLTGVFLY